MENKVEFDSKFLENKIKDYLFYYQEWMKFENLTHSLRSQIKKYLFEALKNIPFDFEKWKNSKEVWKDLGKQIVFKKRLIFPEIKGSIQISKLFHIIKKPFDYSGKIQIKDLKIEDFNISETIEFLIKKLKGDK